MNATVGKAIFNAYFFGVLQWFKRRLGKPKQIYNPKQVGEQWSTAEKLCKPYPHTNNLKHTQGSSFCEVWESVVQLSTLRSDATVSLFLQLGLPTTWSMCLLLLTPGKAVQVRLKLHCCFCGTQDGARTTLYFLKYSLTHPNWIQVFQTLLHRGHCFSEESDTTGLQSKCGPLISSRTV